MVRLKNELRIFVEGLKNKYSFEYKWIRLFYMFGEGQTQNPYFRNSSRLLTTMMKFLI